MNRRQFSTIITGGVASVLGRWGQKRAPAGWTPPPRWEWDRHERWESGEYEGAYRCASVAWVATVDTMRDELRVLVDSVSKAIAEGFDGKPPGSVTIAGLHVGQQRKDQQEVTIELRYSRQACCPYGTVSVAEVFRGGRHTVTRHATFRRRDGTLVAEEVPSEPYAILDI